MTTVPYFGAGGRVSYARELDGTLATHPDFFTPRIRAVELDMQAEVAQAHRRLDTDHLAQQVASEDRWTAMMRNIHSEAHARIDTGRGARAVSPPQVYAPSPSPHAHTLLPRVQ